MLVNMYKVQLIVLLLVLVKESSGKAKRFEDIQEEYFRKRAEWKKERREHAHVGSSYVGPGTAGSGNDNGNCVGNCHDNNNGNDNGNNNAGTANGNNNGNCQGNCVGNENGNDNGNKNGGKLHRSNYNGNNNGNCFGNCYHNKLGNGNGNNNKWFSYNGNNIGNCKGNCFHYRQGLHFGNDDDHLKRNPVPTSCVGNCFPMEQPKVYDTEVLPYKEIVSSDLTCESKDGYTYYVKPKTYCSVVHKRRTVPPSRPARTQCADGEAFDLDICGCNNWWFVDVADTCTSGTGKA